MKPVPVLALLVLLSIAGVVMAGGDVPHLTDADFDEKTADGKVWFLKMYAPWCGHCKSLAPTWAELALSFAGSDSVAIASVDCTQQKAVCQKAGVRGYPTLKVFQNGEEKKQYSGPRTLEALKTFIAEQKHLLSDLTTE